MADGVWVILDDELAPQGYAYLLVMNRRGTVKSCMFSGFKRKRYCLLSQPSSMRPGSFRCGASLQPS